MNNFMKQNKAITLIALTITIIVLLILAGVTISVLTGDNGLITKANEAKTTTEKSAIREEIDLLLLQAQMGENLEDIFKDGTVTKDNTLYEVTYKGEKFLVSDDYEYVEIVEPAYEGEWTFNQSTQTLTSYNGDLTSKRGKQEIGEVIIPNYYNGKRVLSIANRVFLSKEITKLNISYGIETIGTAVFQNCKQLSGEVIIPNSVITMGSHVFASCSELNKVKLSNNLQKVPTYCFSYCTKLTGDIVIPESVTEIAGFAFDGCSLINSLIFLNKDVIINDSGNTISSSRVKIVGYSGSTAEAYATKYRRTFETID